ncbi:MAG: hypothetical protein Q8M92_01025 [Candidatus Subteraquimicrobiales bacterium]|nr:hypothetical protein [Candidatus Subteraquimicrobiales bacterium]
MITVFIQYELDDEHEIADSISKILKERLENIGHCDIVVIVEDVGGKLNDI